LFTYQPPCIQKTVTRTYKIREVIFAATDANDPGLSQFALADPEEECESEMFVWVGRAGERIAVPLAQLRPLSKDQETQDAVGDWLYWVDRGYEL